MIEIYPNTKIYIAAPAATATGGPELLHQLAYHLKNDLDIKAYMYYYPNNHPKPVHPNYEEYGIQFVDQIEDKRYNILVVPETIKGIELLDHFFNIKKIIWWLSVDNFYLSYIFHSKSNFFIHRTINKIYKVFTGKSLIDIAEIALKNKKFKKIQLP
jgi:hypothetical protein